VTKERKLLYKFYAKCHSQASSARISANNETSMLKVRQKVAFVDRDGTATPAKIKLATGRFIHSANRGLKNTYVDAASTPKF
jgi:hypothetical protein